MLLSFFRKSSISVILMVLLILVALWTKTFLSGSIYPFIFDSIKMPLYSLLTNYLSPELFYSKVLTLLTIVAVSFYLLHINGKYIIIKQRTYLPAFLFILISTAFTPLQRINPAVFSSFFIVLAFDHIFAIYQNNNPLDNIFRAGVSLSIASLFYAPAMVFSLSVFIGLVILRSFYLREWIVSFLGLALPWGVFLLVQLWFNVDFVDSYSLVKNNLITQTESSIDELIPIIFASAIGISTFFALVYMIPSMANQKISVRKYQIIFFWFLLLTILVFFIVPTSSYEVAYFAAFPLSFQLTNYFSTTRGKFWPEVFFVLIIMAAIAMQLYPLIVAYI